MSTTVSHASKVGVSRRSGGPCAPDININNKMQSRIDQHAGIKMNVWMGLSQAQIHRNLVQAYGDQAMSKTQVRLWFHRFKSDPDHSTADQKHTGRPRKERVEKIHEITGFLQDDRRATIRQISRGTGTSFGTVQRILKEQKWTKLAPKFVPRILTDAQRACRKTIAEGNLQKIRQDPSLLQGLITTDESWVFTYDPRTKLADLEWTPPEDPRPTKALRARSQKKTMLTMFFDQTGIVYHEFREGGTINTERYVETLRNFREAVRRKCPHLWIPRSFTLLQDNAPAHTSAMAADYFHRVQMDLLSHPPYSPDLAPCDFWLFPMMKKKLKGRRFESLDDLKIEVGRILRATPSEEFQQAFEKLIYRYEQCVASDGHYFEGQRKRSV